MNQSEKLLTITIFTLALTVCLFLFAVLVSHHKQIDKILLYDCKKKLTRLQSYHELDTKSTKKALKTCMDKLNEKTKK